MAEIKIDSVSKSFGETRALREFSVTIGDGELVTFLGPSGCGKTTSLRSVAGFVVPDAGRIHIGPKTVFDRENGVAVPPERRGVGMVFQSYALWPHMRVEGNVGYPLKIHKVPRAERRRRVAEVLELVKMGGLGRRYPHELSGGQQQRVALARALVSDPDALLLDEPLSNLDAKLRENMRIEIKELQRRTGQTVIFVTHDQLEAMELSDRIVVMEGGTIQQIGEPTEIYENPANRFVGGFIGTGNFIDCRQTSEGLACENVPDLILPVEPPERFEGKNLTLMIRPESIVLTSQVTPLTATVAERLFKGDAVEYVVEIDELELRVKTPPGARFVPGEEVHLRIEDAKFFG
jgi:iron(III) transport system ATP-binding protein